MSLIIDSTNSALALLKVINDSYSQLILVILAFVSICLAYKEFVLKRRPFTFPEVTFEKKEADWYFGFILVNKGNSMGLTKVTKALLKIGDEEYFTPVKNEIILSPNERNVMVPIGHINEFGRRKIKGHEYSVNRVEITFNLESKFITDTKYSFYTEVSYLVDVSGEDPVFSVIYQRFT